MVLDHSRFTLGARGFSSVLKSDPREKLRRSCLRLRPTKLLVAREKRPLAPVVQTSDSAIHRINLYPVDSAIGFHNTYPQYRDLSGG